MLVLYHGSAVRFEVPSLIFAKNNRDFGKGFYTTTLVQQAKEWANEMVLRYGGNAHLYTFEFNPIDSLKVLKFSEISTEWLEMVKSNRLSGGTQHNYDVVIGPVANDNTVRTIALYVAGTYDADEAMRRLRYMKPNDQVSLHTAEAMGCLKMLARDLLG